MVTLPDLTVGSGLLNLNSLASSLRPPAGAGVAAFLGAEVPPLLVLELLLLSLLPQPAATNATAASAIAGTAVAGWRRNGVRTDIAIPPRVVTGTSRQDAGRGRFLPTGGA